MTIPCDNNLRSAVEHDKDRRIVDDELKEISDESARLLRNLSSTSEVNLNISTLNSSERITTPAHQKTHLTSVGIVIGEELKDSDSEMGRLLELTIEKENYNVEKPKETAETGKPFIKSPAMMHNTHSPSPGTASALAGARGGAPSLSRQQVGSQLLVILSVVFFFAGTGAALLSPALCDYLSLCLVSKESKNIDQIFSSASRAEHVLWRATTFSDYKLALQQLDRVLGKLREEQLSQRQHQKLEELLASSKKAKTFLAAEQAAQQRVKNAVRVLKVARQRGGDERISQLVVARRELAMIQPRSFADAEARRLRQQLEQLTEAVGASQSVRIPDAPSYSSKPVPPPAFATEQAPYRDKPLF